jgi:hypothetical protein
LNGLINILYFYFKIALLLKMATTAAENIIYSNRPDNIIVLKGRSIYKLIGISLSFFGFARGVILYLRLYWDSCVLAFAH